MRLSNKSNTDRRATNGTTRVRAAWREAKRAFTLIELLVVIAVIAILAALLLPVLNRAQEQGRSASCQSNLRQLAVALRMYVDDFKVYPPVGNPLPPGGTSDPDYPVFYFQMMYPYTKQRWVYENWRDGNGDQTNGGMGGWTGQGIWTCPSLAHLSSAWPWKMRTLQCNFQGFGFDTNGRSLGLAAGVYAPPIRESEVLAPANMIAMGDPNGRVLSDPWSLPLVSEKLRPLSVAGWIELGIMPDQSDNRVLKVWRPAQKIRHGGRWHIQCCDGHVAKFRTGDLFDVRQEDVRKRWNRDNAPHVEITLQTSPYGD